MQAPVYRTVVGALREYDLPDLVAVAASKQGPSDSPPRSGVLVLGPRSAMLSSLSQPEAEAVYVFARQQQGGTSSVHVVSGEHTATQAATAVRDFIVGKI